MIHLECDNDEALMLALGKPRAEISHHAGKGRVSWALQRSKSNGDLGLVDQDPGQPPPPYLREYQVVESVPHLGLVLYRHPQDGKRLIEVCPDLEPWLYQIGPALNIEPSAHHLPTSHKGLHQSAKKHRAHLLAYLEACRVAESEHLEKLVHWTQMS